MTSAYIKALKAELAKQQAVSTGSVLLDQAFEIPMQGFLLIYGEALVGTTAIALELAKELAKDPDQLIIYVDVFNSGAYHRVSDIDQSKLLIWKAWDFSPREFLEILSELKTATEYITIIFENLSYLESAWSYGWEFKELAIRIKQNNPKCTIIGTSRRVMYSDRFWNTIIHLERGQNVYCQDEDYENILAGHYANVTGPKGKTIIYIDHFTGRVSKAFEIAKLSIADGTKTKNSVFELDGVRAQGVWKFIHTVGKTKRNELRIGQLPD